MSDKTDTVDLGPVMRQIVEKNAFHEWFPVGKYGLEMRSVSSAHPAGYVQLRREGSPNHIVLPTPAEFEPIHGPGAMWVLSESWPKISVLGQSDEEWWKLGDSNDNR